jgi:CBS-domain-containing membrane protein
MASNLPEARTALHKRLQSVTQVLESEGTLLTTGIATLGTGLTGVLDKLDTHLTELTKAVESRPPPRDQIDYVLKTRIEVAIGPTKQKCWSVGADQSLLQAAYLMNQKRLATIFLKENERIVGLVTRGKVLAALESGKTNEPATESMVKHGDFIGLRLSDTVKTALDLFEEHRLKRLVVRDAKDRPVALLTSGHLLRWLGQKLSELHSAQSAP